MITVAAYDIRQDDRRSRVAALLQAYGDRVQKSVFVLDVELATLAQVRRRAAEIIDPATDSLHWFPQCATCWGGVTFEGQASKPEHELFWAVM